MGQIRRSVLVLVAFGCLQVGACTFGGEDTTSSSDAGTGGAAVDASMASGGAPDGSGGRKNTGGTSAAGGRGAGGASSGGAAGALANGGTSSGGAGKGGASSGGASAGGSSSGGASGAGTGGNATGGVDTGAGGAGTGGAGTGGTGGTGAGGVLVDASIPDGDASTDGGGACGRCPSGQYCDVIDLVCRPGCGSGAVCASGRCGASHDCDRCVNDAECAAGRVCSTGTCLPTCTATQDCPSGYECCGNRCANLTKDHRHCGSCSAVCVSVDYCSSTGCKATSVAAVCDTPHVTLLLDGAPVDDAVTAQVATALATQCPSTPGTTTESETSSAAINPVTGQPVAGAGDLVVALGGPFSQKVTRYYESAGLTRVYDLGKVATIGFYGRGTDGGADPSIVAAPIATLTDNHDYFKIELVVDPVSGTRLLQVYGLFAPGTAAAGWFLMNRVLPNLSSFNLRYYVYEWTHGDAGANPGPNDSFKLVASGN